MLINDIEALIQKIKSSDTVSPNMVPVSIITALDAGASGEEVGNLLIGLRRKKYRFDVSFEKVSTYQEAADRLKNAKSKEEEFFYALIFISLTNRATFQKVCKIIDLTFG